MVLPTAAPASSLLLFNVISSTSTVTFQLITEEQIQSLENQLFALHLHQQDQGVHTQAQKACELDSHTEPQPM